MFDDNLKVLYVEDNEDIADETIFFLEMFIDNLFTASNGKEGLEKFIAHKPDVVVTDLQMPIMGGIEMIEKIREITPEIPIIITTAFNEVEYLTKAIELNVSSYLLKPLNLKSLKKNIYEAYEPINLKNKLVEKNKEFENLNQNLEKLVDEKTIEIKKNIAFLNSYKEALDISQIVSVTDKNGIIKYVNENCCEISGYSKEELIGQNISLIRDEDNESDIFENIDNMHNWQGIVKNKKKDGSFYWVNLSVVAIFDENDEIYEFISISKNITSEVKQKQKLFSIANIDQLTGLYNRNKFLEDLEDKDNYCLSLVNIKNFRDINEFYGFEFGDKLIKAFSKTIANKICDSNVHLYRLNADEFAILIKQGKSKEDIFSFLDNLLDTVANHNCKIDEQSISIEIYISVSFEDSDFLKTVEMLKDYAKKSKKGLLVYDRNLNLEEESENYLKWINKIKKAYSSDGFIPYFQPIVNNQTLEWEKSETLVRLKDENGEIFTPYHFLSIAKKSKYYTDITKSMVEKSFEYFSTRKEFFSINLSVRDMIDSETQLFILSQLNEYQNTQNIIFELEESEGIDRFDEIISFIEKVKTFGCKIAIDDFGTGYSNFEYLLRLKADFIKIDGSLVKDIVTNKNSEIVVRNIVRFAQDLGIKSIAEFVENEEIFNKVRDLGVDYSQGYYFSKPLEKLD